jgi:hypothetical protein
MVFISYNSFWTLANRLLRQRHDLAYHPCCDSWTKSYNKARSTHIEKVPWRKLMASLDPKIKDKKQALKMKLVEDQCRLNVVLNEPCGAKQNSQLASQFHKPVFFPQETQASLANPQLSSSGQTQTQVVPPEGRYK